MIENILDKLYTVINDNTVKLGYLPDAPDELSVLKEYTGSLPNLSFGRIDITKNIQLRTRGVDSYKRISDIADKLHNYCDSEISVIQTTDILDIGRDSKGRQEYTVNFKIWRK